MKEENLAVADAERPQITALREALQGAIGDFGLWYARMSLVEEMTFAVWAGQTDDGLKHAAGKTDEDPFPWEGASDSRNYLALEKLKESMRICSQSVKRARRAFQPSKVVDAGHATRMSSLLQWQVENKMEGMAERERQMALFWRNQLGLSVSMVDWERSTNTRLESVDRNQALVAMGLGEVLEMIAQMQMTPEMAVAQVGSMLNNGMELQPEIVQAWQELANAMDLLTNPERLTELVGYAAELFPEVKRGPLRKAMKELQETGETRLPQPYLVRDRARRRALKVGDDVFFPANTEALEDAPWIAVREWLEETDVREAVKTRGWSEAFRDAVLASKGQSSTEEARSSSVRGSRRSASGVRSFEGGMENYEELCEVFCFYHWGADDWGNRGLYKTELSLHVGESDRDAPYGSHGLSEYEHGMVPFREHVFFRDARELINCAGIPYLIYTHQQALKTQRDYRADYLSISILPPMKRHPLDMQTDVDLSPGGFVYEHIRGSTEWMPPPRAELGALVSLEESTRLDAERLAGSWNEKIPQPTVMLHQQEMADGYLLEERCILKQIFKLMQQYIEEETVFRAAGPGEKPFQVTHEEIQGDFDLRLTFDARELNEEFVEKKMGMLERIMSVDWNARIDRNRVVELFCDLVDSTYRESLLQDPADAAQKEVEDEEQVLMRMFIGIESPMQSEGQNFQVRLDWLMGQMQENPKVQQAFQSDPGFAELLENRLKHLRFMVGQRENAQIGRVGTEMVQGEG